MWKQILPLILIAGCSVPSLPGRRTREPKGLAQARAAIAREDWADGRVRLCSFLRKSPSHPCAGQARFLLATYYLRNHELEVAKREFMYVASHAKGSRLARQARIRIADTARAAREYGEAEKIYKDLLRNARAYGDGAQILFRLGLIKQRNGDWGAADRYFQKVERFYPDSPFACRAAEQKALPHHFSLQVAAFGNQKNARKKQMQLRNKGHRSSIRKRQRHGKQLYCVLVGAFSSRKDALAFKSKRLQDPDLRYSNVVP